MTDFADKKYDFYTGLILLLLVIPMFAIMRTIDPELRYTIKRGDEVDVPESVQTSLEPFTPLSALTFINETQFENGKNWLIWYEEYRDVSVYERYVNLPMINTTEFIIGATFNVNNPRDISIGYGYGFILNTTIAAPNQNSTLTFHCTPNEFPDYIDEHVSGKVGVYLEIEGNFKDGIPMTDFWGIAITNATLYPVIIDIQRTDGESLFSNPTMRYYLYETGGYPSLFFRLNDSISIGKFDPIQSNDTLLLPEGNYNYTFIWGTYEIEADFIIEISRVRLVQRIRCVRVDVECSPELVGYYVTYPWFAHFALIDQPSFYRPSGSEWQMDIRGNNGYISPTVTAGTNLNITVLVKPMVFVIGPIAIAPGEMLSIVSLLLLSVIVVFGKRWLNLANKKIIPFSLLVLSFLFPSVTYGFSTLSPRLTTNNRYTIFYSIFPGISSSSTNTDDSLIFLMHELDMVVTLVFYVLLFLAFVGVLLEEFNSVPRFRSDAVFWFSSICILIANLEVIGKYTLSLPHPNYLFVIPGPGPFIVVFSLVAWFLLRRG
jgi:hypothetical protein